MARGKASADASELEKLEWPYDWPPPWRSERLLGHEAAEQTLLAAFGTGRLHHAWLLAGPRGIGKATLAWRFARFLLAGQAQGGLFGDGPEKEKLVALAGQRKLPNMKFYPPQPRAQILDIIRCFDVAVVPLRKLELCLGTLPSKMFEAMGAGVPVVASVLGEAQAIVNEAGGGICVPPEDPQAIADAILQLYNDPALRAGMGRSGRQYVMRSYNRAHIARNYEQLLQKATELPSADFSRFVNLQSVESRPECPQAD